jgi:tetratricopeptide (TPR) repeat protein
VLDRAIAFDEREQLAFYLQGLAYTELGDLNRALTTVSEAVARVNGDYGRWSIFQALAHVHGLRGELDRAEQALRDGLAQLPDSRELRDALSQFLRAIGKSEEDGLA